MNTSGIHETVFSIQHHARVAEAAGQADKDRADVRGRVLAELDETLQKAAELAGQVALLADNDIQAMHSGVASIRQARTFADAADLAVSSNEHGRAVPDHISTADTAARKQRQELARLHATAANLTPQLQPLLSTVQSMHGYNEAARTGAAQLHTTSGQIYTAADTYYDTL